LNGAIHSLVQLLGKMMQAASVEKQVKDLLAMVVALEAKRETKQAGVLKRAVRMLQEQQVEIALKRKPGVDLRPSKAEETAQMARVGRSYYRARRAKDAVVDPVLEAFHSRVDTLIAKD
jgi:hypothetical protein